MSPPRANAQVVFMGAAWYSGSTMLGVMLGAHRSIFYAGEANKTRTLADPRAPLKQRVCRLCGPGCELWDDLTVTDREDLYEVLSRRSRRPIVFDSTKEIDWIDAQLAALGGVVPVRLIVLTRDGRAVVSSWRRKLGEPGRVGDLAASWAQRMGAVEELAARFPGPVHRMRYEELASRPEAALGGVADFVGVEFERGMLDPWCSEQHPLGGNDGPLLLMRREGRRRVVPGVITPGDRARDWYAAHPAEIVLDLRWKDDLSAADLAEFERTAGEANRAYAWKQPA